MFLFLQFFIVLKVTEEIQYVLGRDTYFALPCHVHQQILIQYFLNNIGEFVFHILKLIIWGATLPQIDSQQ